MSIEIHNESAEQVDEQRLLAVATYALDALWIHPGAELNLLLVDPPAIEKLHIEWMDEPGPTDVLSFPMDELRPGDEHNLTPAGILGDIVLCPQVAAEQAERAGHSTSDELLLLTVHGILHLLGFDHAEPQEKAEMFGLQTVLLTGFKRDERGA